MPFIGKQPEVGAYQLIDSITTSATATYALTVDGSAYFPASARNLIVSLNGVTQAPESAYTVSGSNIVFDSALTASDVIDYILVIGDAVDIGTPSDGTVGTSQLASSIDLSGKTLTFANDQISGNAVDGGTISNFASTGIDDNATSTAVTIDSSENVGIGTASPLSPLHIEGSDDVVVRIKATGADSLSRMILQNDARTWTIDNDGANSDSLTIYDATSAIERMRIDSSGNVGIGTTNPINTLHVHTPAGGPTLRITSTATGQTSNTDGFHLGTDGAGGIYLSQNETQPIYFYTGATEKARLDASGNLLVGTTSSALVDSGCRLNASGRLSAICPTANSAGLFGRSNDGPLLVFYIGGTSVGSIQHTSGTVAIAQASDERLKENVEEISGCLDQIKQIRPVSWDWKEREGGSIGVVAQEIQQIWPDVVDEGDDGYLTVAGISRVEARLIKAIQEQQAMIETLQAQVAELQGAN